MIARLLALALAVLPAADADYFARLRDVDRRMATIAWRLQIGNAALCDELAPAPGIAIHAIGQYDPGMRAEARAAFGFAAPVAVEAVVAGSAAAQGGLVDDDGLLTVNGAAFPSEIPARADAGGRDAALALVARQPAGRPIRLGVVRGGRRLELTVPASPGCRSNFEVLLGPKMEASSDGAVVQIGVRFFERYDDAQVAVVVAHELAHTILRHRARLDAAGVKRGLLAEVGRNGRLFRRTEAEADLLGVHLMRNAGYDPQTAVRFWREHGGDVDGGLFRSRTHPSSKARAAAIAAELAALPGNAPRPYRPPILATRDSPLG
jgi:hypothetical protein